LLFGIFYLKVDSKGGSWRGAGGAPQPPWLFRRKANPPAVAKAEVLLIGQLV